MIKRWWFLLPLVVGAALLMNGLLTANRLISEVVKTWESAIGLDVFLQDNISPEQRAALERRIDVNPQVRSYKYLSKDDAFAERARLSPDSPAVVYGVKDALPASYRVELNNFSATTNLSHDLSRRPGVREVHVYGADAGKLLTVTTLVKRVLTAALAAALLFLSFIAGRSFRTPNTPELA